MSTWVRFACIDHSPPIVSEAEYGQHDETDEMREVLSNRDDWCDIVDDERIEIVHAGCRNAAKFFNQHPSCNIACVDEYGYWTDLGMGLPRGVKVKPTPDEEPVVP